MLGDDLQPFFSSAFAKTILYTPAGHAHVSNKSRSISAISDEFTADNGRFGVQSESLLITVQKSEIEDVTDGARVRINDIDYTIREFPEDGGVLICKLEKDKL